MGVINYLPTGMFGRMFATEEEPGMNYQNSFSYIGLLCWVIYIYIYRYIPWKSKDQTLPIGSRESFTWIIPKTILCLVLDFQGIHIYRHVTAYIEYIDIIW